MTLQVSKTLRQIYLLGAYAIGLLASLWLAFELRFDFDVPPNFLGKLGWILLVLVGLKLVLLGIFGQFGSLLSYFGFHDLGKILLVSTLAAAFALATWFFFGLPYAPPRAVIVVDFLLSCFFLCGFRLSLRLVREGYFELAAPSSHRRIAIIGAGDVGALLARDLLLRRGLGMTPVVFFDDDPSKWGTTLHGLLVNGAPEALTDYVRRHSIEEVIIAMPSAPARRVREILGLLNRLHLRSEIVPSYRQLLTGKVRVSQIRPVEIQDLLGRAPVDLQTDRIRDLIAGRAILVTGAGGSIGAELCRQIATYAPRQLLMVERSEYLLFQIQQELHDLGFGAEIVPLVADVLDAPRMRGIFERFTPAVIFHAAAHKHVPMMEFQPGEAFRNNVLGTKQLAETAIAHKVERFVLISTDKAINPTSVMGATKRLAELHLQSLQKHSGCATKFMAVRFGNVLGSSGSVIPTFKKQIAGGGPVTVTHAEVTRYFMTVNEAAGLVLQSATQGQGGEIFILDMGQPLKIVDLARQLIELSGLDPDRDIEIQFTGLRPGEKLFEELNHNTERHVSTAHPKIMRFVGEPQDLAVLMGQFHQLQQFIGAEPAVIKRMIQQIVPEYQPHLETA